MQGIVPVSFRFRIDAGMLWNVITGVIMFMTINHVNTLILSARPVTSLRVLNKRKRTDFKSPCKHATPCQNQFRTETMPGIIALNHFDAESTMAC